MPRSPTVALYEQEGNDHVNHLVDLVGRFTPGTFIEAKLTHMGASRMATCDARLGVSAGAGAAQVIQDTNEWVGLHQTQIRSNVPWLFGYTP